MRQLADSWQEELLPALMENLGDGSASVEERIVYASLQSETGPERDGVHLLFHLMACFPEDAVVRASVFDALAPLLATWLGTGDSLSKLRMSAGGAARRRGEEAARRHVRISRPRLLRQPSRPPRGARL